MKLIKQILFLTAVLFLYSCTSTKSIVNCPDFKSKKKPLLKVSKIKTAKTKKKLAFQKRSTKKATRKAQLVTKKLNKLQLQAVNRIVDADIWLPLKENDHLGKELSGLRKEFKIKDDLEVTNAKTRVDQNRKAEKLILERTPKVAKPNSSITNFTKTSKVNKKRFIKKLSKKPQNFGDDKVEPLAILGLLFSLASFIAFGIPFGITGIILGTIGLMKFKKHPNRRGRALAMLAIVVGLIAVILVAGYLASL